MFTNLKWLVTIGAIILIFVGPVLAQQDPDDLGLQDSLGIIYLEIPYGDTSAQLLIWAKTDDSVAFYNFPLTCHPMVGGIHLTSDVEYFYPLTQWDDTWDTLAVEDDFLMMIGWADIFGDPNPWLQTDYQKLVCWSIKISIDSTAIPQLAYVDTTYDPHNGRLMIGLNDGLSQITPGFQYGIIDYGPFRSAEDNSNLPSSFTLRQNYPNPFNAETKIDFALPSAQFVRLEIFDIMGRKIRTIFDDHLDAGYHSIQWNGTDNNGDQISSGIYFYRLTAGDFSETHKMILMK